MKKISQVLEGRKKFFNAIQQEKDLIDAFRPAIQQIFAEPVQISSALSGLTLEELSVLRFLLSRCCRHYLSVHPAAFSRSLLIALENDTGLAFDIYVSQSSKNEAQSTSTS